jgi:hypothetical protein
LSTIFTGHETWIHHFEPKMKRQSMEWHNTTYPRKKRFKAIPSAGKIMATVFWDCEGVILIHVLPRGQKMNSRRLCGNYEEGVEEFLEGSSP